METKHLSIFMDVCTKPELIPTTVHPDCELSGQGHIHQYQPPPPQVAGAGGDDDCEPLVYSVVLESRGGAASHSMSRAGGGRRTVAHNHQPSRSQSSSGNTFTSRSRGYIVQTIVLQVIEHYQFDWVGGAEVNLSIPGLHATSSISSTGKQGTSSRQFSEEETSATGSIGTCWSVFVGSGQLGLPEEGSLAEGECFQFDTPEEARGSFEQIFLTKTNRPWSPHAAASTVQQFKVSVGVANLSMTSMLSSTSSASLATGSSSLPPSISTWSFASDETNSTFGRKPTTPAAAATSPPVDIKRVICYGDSLTEGYSSTDAGHLVFYPYAKQLEAASNGHLRGVGSGYGVSGQMTFQILDRLRRNIFSRPALTAIVSAAETAEQQAHSNSPNILRGDVVVIQGGTNDIARGLTVKATMGHLSSMVTAALDADPSIIVLCTIPPMAEHNELDAEVQATVSELRRQLNDAIRAAVEAFSARFFEKRVSFRCCDLYTMLSEEVTTTNPNPNTNGGRTSSQHSPAALQQQRQQEQQLLLSQNGSSGIRGGVRSGISGVFSPVVPHWAKYDSYYDEYLSEQQRLSSSSNNNSSSSSSSSGGGAAAQQGSNATSSSATATTTTTTTTTTATATTTTTSSSPRERGYDTNTELLISNKSNVLIRVLAQRYSMAGGSAGRNGGGMKGDAVHLNAVGYNKMAQCVAQSILKKED